MLPRELEKVESTTCNECDPNKLVVGSTFFVSSNPSGPTFPDNYVMFNRWQKESLRDEGQKASTPVMVAGKKTLPHTQENLGRVQVIRAGMQGPRAEWDVGALPLPPLRALCFQD